MIQAHLVSNLLAATINDYALTQRLAPHPLDLLANVLPSYLRLAGTTVYSHPQERVREIIITVATAFRRPLQELDTRSVCWSLSKFPTEIVERAFMKHELSTLPQDVMGKLTMALASLEQALLEKDQLMPRHLASSHQLLISYPESVHLLDDQEIALLMSAARVHTGIEITKAATAKPTSRKKITADDL